MAHHGMKPQHGIMAMCEKDDHNEGRFGRLFPGLPPLYTKPSELKKLGAQNGPMDGGKARNDSQSIPMGMVFLGQFIDHDITLDTTSRLDKVNDPNAIFNFRTPALDLDCVYGLGPEATNFLFKDGVSLLTGKDGTALASQAQNHRDNDVARTSTGTAIIGDPRNDENRVISQLQLAIINFHNHVVAHLQAADPSLTHGALFEKANEEVRWHYHWMILNEFLPTMIGAPLVQEIMSDGRKLFTPHKGQIPIEFSAAAYRFGHSLAPQKLKVRKAQTHDFELFGGTLGFGFQPISDDKQIIEWEVLFNIDATPFQTTDKLDTKMPTDLLALPFIPAGSENSLATRNLLRGQSFLLPSGEKASQAAGIDQAIIDKVTAHVKGNTTGIDLSNGTPLWYYILAEAECIGRNDVGGNNPSEGLGPLGGRIVGETLIGLMELDTTSFLSVDRNWTPNLTTSGDFTMKDLLTFS